MKNTVIRKDGYKYTWSVRGLNEVPCINDIEFNKRTSLTDYVATMFAERYGCVAEVESVREMTHNQYQEFLKVNASRLYSEKGYTVADYRRDADSVAILDYDLDRFELSAEAKKAINVFFDSESVNKNGHLRLSGHSDHVYALADTLGCKCVSDGAYNGFFKNDDSRLVFSFCEGDISLILCENDEEYRSELASYYEFYEIEPDFEPEEVCIEVYFDGVHMDNVFCPKDKADAMISSLVQNGYEDYNGNVKEYWELMQHGRPNPDLSFKVVESPEKTMDAVLADAAERSAETAGIDKEKEAEYGKE